MNIEDKKTGASSKINTSSFTTTIPLTSKALIMINNPKKNIFWSDQFKSVLDASKNNRKWLMVIASNDGILTHQFSQFGLKSNNTHNMTQSVNPRIIPKGFVVAKVVHTNPNQSWRWHLWPVSYALTQPISDTLRVTILKHMKAANDE